MRIEILLPTYNAGTYLVEAIESIKGQTLKDWRLIVLDGGSDDVTHDIVRHYCRLDPRIELNIMPGSHPVERTNGAICRSEADLIAFQHADDISAPERLARQVDAFRSDPHLTLLGTAIRIFEHNMSECHKIGYQGIRVYPVGYENILARLPFFWCFSLPSIMFHRKRIADGLTVSEDYQFSADYDWYYRIAKRHRVNNLPEPLLSYRSHLSSDGPRNRDMVNDEYNIIRKRVILAEFPFLDTQSVDILLKTQFEPDCSLLSSSEQLKIKEIFFLILQQHEGTASSKNQRQQVYKKYLKKIRNYKLEMRIKHAIKQLLFSYPLSIYFKESNIVRNLLTWF
jgi:glycosyltransferase involved in cell wall biosynthesis